MWPQAAGAQAFSADYGLRRAGAGLVGLDAPARKVLFSVGPFHVAPAVRAGMHHPTVGLSLQAGRHWFAQVGLGRGAQPGLWMPGADSPAVLNIDAGYRWSDGQSLSFQFTGGRGTDRLGLAVSYDWPRYFVGLSYDARLHPVPQDKLRVSAGLRF